MVSKTLFVVSSILISIVIAIGIGGTVARQRSTDSARR
jgi:hypothetical protein